MKRVFQWAWFVGLASVAPAILATGGPPIDSPEPLLQTGVTSAGQPGRGPQASTQTQKGTGIILGQVVDAATGQPVPDAVVTLSSRVLAAAVGAQTQAISQTVVLRSGGSGAVSFTSDVGLPTPPGQRVLTDGEGRFVFHDLPKGNQALTATAPGYLSGSTGQSRPGGPSRAIELDEGERAGDVKIRLWKYAVLTGTVVDEAGEPAVGAMVRLFRRVMTSGKARFTPSSAAPTDDRGIYRFSTITPGDYIVAVPQAQAATIPVGLANSLIQGVASGSGMGAAFADIMMSGGPAPTMGGVRVGDAMLSSMGGLPPELTSDGRIFVYQSAFYPTGTTSAQAAVVSLRSGEERGGIDLQLRLIPTARVSGVVTGPPGMAANLGVRLVPADSDEDSGMDAANTVTAADGSFTFLGVPSGQYVAKATRQPRPPLPPELAGNTFVQFAFGDGFGGGRGGQTQPTLYAQTPVSVGAQDVTGVSLILAEGSKVSGRLEFEGSAPPPTAQQLQTFTVTLSSPTAGPSSQARVEQDGQFNFRVSAGKYILASTGRGGGPWTLKSATVGGRDVLNEPLELKDADVTGVVITYTDKTTQLSGTARASGAATTNGITVVIFPADYQTWIGNGMSSRRSRTALAAKNGSYSINALPAGDYLIAALDDTEVGDTQDPNFFATLARVATRVSIADGEKKAMDLQTVRIGR